MGVNEMMNWGQRFSASRIGNFMGASGFGSFAPVGELTTPTTPNPSPRRYFALEIGEACQLQCRHCIYHRDHSKSPKPKQAYLVEAIEELHRSFDPIWITFAGKEPTIFPKQLVATARALRRTETLSILMTNGLLLDDGLIDDLAETIDLFDVSLDGSKASHEWMRGEGTYEATWARIDSVLQRTSSRIGIIATAVNNGAAAGHDQNASIVDLARDIVTKYGDSGRIVLSISLYYGAPTDPMLLNASGIADLISRLHRTGCPVRVPVTANYAHQWPEVAKLLGLADAPTRFDIKTGLPVVKFGAVRVLVFNLTQAPQISARLSNDGYVYLGCNHLSLGERATRYAVADISKIRLQEVLTQLSHGIHRVYDTFEEMPQACATCFDFAACRGGDRLSGIYYGGEALDPYCSRLAHGQN